MEKLDLHVLLVDDDPHAIRMLENLLEPFEEIKQVSAASGVEQGIEMILNSNPDLVFLDIDMPGKNGFELIHELAALELEPTIIFQTAWPDYSIEAIRHQAFDYLLKPVDPTQLKKAIRRFQCSQGNNRVNNQPTNEPLKIAFSIKGGSIFINPDDIFYINAEGSYSEIFFTNGQTRVVTLVLAKVLELLPAKCFVRISRSIAINSRYLKELDRKKRLVHLEADELTQALKVSHKYLKGVEGCF